MKYVSKILLIIFVLLFIDSVSTHFVLNKSIEDIPNLQKKILDLNTEIDKLKSENNKLNNENRSLRSENNYLRSIKTIGVPEYHIIEYGNQELLDEIEELESERDELQSKQDELESENEDLRDGIDDDY